MTRILYVSPGPALGGAERSLLDLIGGLPRHRFDPVLLVGAEGACAEEARRMGVEVIVVPWPTALRRLGRERRLANRGLALAAPLVVLPMMLRIARLARRLRIGVAHTNGTKAHVIALGLALAGVPVIWHLRDVVAPGSLRFVLRGLARVVPRVVVANSQASARSLWPSGWASRAQVVYNGLDLRRFGPGPPVPAVRRSLGLPDDAFIVGSVGALSPLKGHQHLIRAMPRILREAPDVRLLIVGEEMYETIGHEGHADHLRRTIAELNLQDRVVLAGRREDMVDIYRSIDALVLSSIRPESFGRVLIEAMACQRPVIATDLGGPREILGEPGCGLLVAPGDPEALSRAVLQLRRDRALRERLGRAGRSRVESLFRLERHVQEICALYDGLAPSAPVPQPEEGRS